MDGFLLGLANGATCLAYCAPVLIPLFLSEGRKTGGNWILLTQFLGGRLAGYLFFALVAWAANWVILRDVSARTLIFGGIYLLLAAALVYYSLAKKQVSCGAELKTLRARLKNSPALLPAVLGLLTGLNLCPPFLLAFTNAALNGTLLGSLLFFITFFIGTSIYMLPLPFMGFLQRTQALQTIGKLATLVAALYYAYTGIIYILQGVLA